MQKALIMGLWAVCAWGFTAEYDDALRELQKHVTEKSWAQAAETFRTAQSLEPARHEAYLAHARGLWDKGDKEQAGKQLDLALKLAPEDIRATIDRFDAPPPPEPLPEAPPTDAEAKYKLAVKHLEGIGTVVAPEKALPLLRDCAAMDNPRALSRLANMYASGQAVRRNQAEAEKLYDKAIALWKLKPPREMDYESNFLYGKAADFRNDATEAYWRYMRCVHNEIYARGARNLALLYAQGRGVEQNDAKARLYYFQAANGFKKEAETEDSAFVQFWLGQIHLNGEGTGTDYFEAMQWFKKAAQKRHLDAYVRLGHMYSTGLNAARDYAVSARYYRKAAEMNIPEAQYALAFQYANGQGVEKSQAEMLQWLRKSADGGYSLAQYSVGTVYEGGLLGIAEDPAEAARMYRAAAEQDHGEAAFRLGLLFEREKNYPEALKWLNAGAKADVAPAHRAIARFYRDGKGVAVDLKEARKWYLQAVRLGDELGRIELNDLPDK